MGMAGCIVTRGPPSVRSVHFRSELTNKGARILGASPHSRMGSASPRACRTPRSSSWKGISNKICRRDTLFFSLSLSLFPFLSMSFSLSLSLSLSLPPSLPLSLYVSLSLSLSLSISLSLSGVPLSLSIIGFRGSWCASNSSLKSDTAIGDPH